MRLYFLFCACWKAGLGRASSLALFTAALLCAGQPQQAFAQHLSGDAFNQHLIDASNRTLENLLEIFRPHVDVSKLHLLNKDRINVVPLAGFNAYYIVDTKEIQIPLGIVSEIHLQAHAYIYTKNHPASNKRYNDWILYLAERSQRVAERVAQKKTDIDDIPIQNFWTYAALPAPEPLNQEDADTVAKLMLSSLGLILAHELGHLILEHPPYDKKDLEQSRKHEQEADDFGADLVQKSIGSTLPGLLTGYLRFVISEEMFHPFNKDKDKHPRAACRTSKMLKSELGRLFKSEDEKAKFLQSVGISASEMRGITDTANQCAADSSK